MFGFRRMRLYNTLSKKDVLFSNVIIIMILK